MNIIAIYIYLKYYLVACIMCLLLRPKERNIFIPKSNVHSRIVKMSSRCCQEICILVMFALGVCICIGKFEGTSGYR